MALKRKSKAGELETVYRKQRDNAILKEFRGDELFIFPNGPEYPEVLFIGELGPYTTKTLQKVIVEVGLNPHRCRFSSIWKHRRTKEPTDVEFAAVLAYVEQEVAILRPKVVVPIGQEALSVFMERECITNTHGNPYDWESHWLIPVPRPPIYYTLKIGGMTEEQQEQFEGDLAAFRYDLTTVAYYKRRGMK